LLEEDFSMAGRPAPGFWQAPLVPVAVAATAGIVADRCAEIPLPLSLAVVVAGLAAWAAVGTGPKAGLALLYLLGSIAALGAAYHHWRRQTAGPEDISRFASPQPRPVVLRGVLEEEPSTGAAPPQDPLRSFVYRPITRTVLRVNSIRQRDEWTACSGLARLTVTGDLKGVHVGDEVEVVGRLLAPQGPANPGESDFATALRDQGIHAVVQVREAPDNVVCLADRSLATAAGWLARVRGHAHRSLEELLPEHQQGLAMALLLGEDYMLQQMEWDKYQRTGVIHVLAISGQHLAVLAAFLWLVLRLFPLRGRYCACLVALFLLGYALLTGGRPPVMRSAVMACALCGGILLWRPTNLPNLFALSWLAVAIINPTDLFTGGCQLSFLSVAVILWGLRRRTDTNADPLQRLKDESRPIWLKGLRGLARQVLLAYGLTLAIWLAVAPLVAHRYHLVSLSGLPLGPPVVLLSSVALLAGFAALLLAPLCWPLALLAAWPLRLGLAGCEGLVNLGQRPGWSFWYVCDIPEWWLWIFYLGLLAALTVGALRQRWPQFGLALAAWLCVGLLAGAVRAPAGDELRCTFLAVGHGGCTVLETPDGRTFLYDAGVLSGPDVTRRFIAPYLWNRGIKRIDEIFVSHAHIDHYNGLVALLDRFAVGQVSCTPTFTSSNVPGARLTAEALRHRGVPMRFVRAGDPLMAGGVSFDVLHPPRVGPDGTEDVRSMVLLVRHLGHSVLLTGDLEVVGQRHLFASMPRLAVDVMQAPHHGSRKANNPDLARWAQPRVVISCQGPPVWPARGPDPYQAINARLLPTWQHGAVIVHSSREGLWVETFRTKERWAVAD
jgi:competence protein ComEC